MSNRQLGFLKRDSLIQCPPCYMISQDNNRLHIFQNTKGLSSHISKCHTLSRLELAKIKELYKKYNSGSFLKLCRKEGIIY